MKALVTGGAGFIGSHLVDRLMETGNRVRVMDNLSSGSPGNLERWMGKSGFEFMEADLLDHDACSEAVGGCSWVFHLAANPEVRANKASAEEHFRQNIQATYRLLEAVTELGGVELMVFASTSTVYGEADRLPTPESYGPTKPISMYGASKLACEALISAYASMNGYKAVIYRLANVVGPRSNHGVVWDFVGKLRENPDTLEVLGDGTQSKSYLYIDDCVEGFLKGVESADQISVFNLGSIDRLSVLRIAEVVREEAGHPEATIRLTGGVDGGRGWKGDVKLMQLDTSSLRRLGWAPRYGSEEAVRLTARAVSSQRS
jgi:UDP-glucose 4-epimerase